MSIKLGDIKLFTIKELSERLEVTEVTLRAYVRGGKLKGQKAGTRWMISEENLREFFDGLRPEEKKEKEAKVFSGVPSV